MHLPILIILFKPSEANQENEKKTNNIERTTRNIMISDPTNCVDG